MNELISNQGHLFDIPRDVTYINCAYLSPLLQDVRAAGMAGIMRKVRPWTIMRGDFYDELEQARAGFARLIGASADDISVIPSTSYGAATAAVNLPLRSGQSVVLIEGEHGSNVRAWHVLAREREARVVTVARPGDSDWTAAILAAIDAATAIIALPNVYWTDGALIDLVAIGERARASGAAMVVDGTQSIGALPLDLHRVQPDFLICSAYKWLLCPYTLAFLYVAPRWQSGKPLEQHSYNRAGTESQEGATDYPEAFAPGARRYDMGERSNFVNLPMAIPALAQLQAWTIDRIAATLKPLVDAVAERGAELGLTAPPPRHRAPHMIGLASPKRPWPADLQNHLAAQKIYVSQRGSALRISPHLYNSPTDLDRLFTGLKALL